MELWETMTPDCALMNVFLRILNILGLIMLIISVLRLVLLDTTLTIEQFLVRLSAQQDSLLTILP